MRTVSASGIVISRRKLVKILVSPAEGRQEGSPGEDQRDGLSLCLRPPSNSPGSRTRRVRARVGRGFAVNVRVARRRRATGAQGPAGCARRAALSPQLAPHPPAASEADDAADPADGRKTLARVTSTSKSKDQRRTSDAQEVLASLEPRARQRGWWPGVRWCIAQRDDSDRRLEVDRGRARLGVTLRALVSRVLGS